MNILGFKQQISAIKFVELIFIMSRKALDELVNQCLRCQEPCRDDAEFCENCRAHLQYKLHQSSVLSKVSNAEQVICTIPQATNNPDQLIERSTSNSPQNGAVGPKNELVFSSKTSTLALRETKKIILIRFED